METASKDSKEKVTRRKQLHGTTKVKWTSKEENEGYLRKKQTKQNKKFTDLML